MTSFSADVDERAGWVLTGQSWAYPSRFHIRTEVDGFSLYMLVLTADDGPQVSALSMEHPQLAMGAPITQATLRKITIERLVRQGVEQVRRPARVVNAERGWYAIEGEEGIWGGRPLRVGRGSQTGDDHLAQVADIYQRAVREGRPPVRAVEAEMFCSRSHAGRLVGQARTAGLISTTRPGRISTAEAQQLTPVEQDAAAE